MTPSATFGAVLAMAKAPAVTATVAPEGTLTSPDSRSTPKVEPARTALPVALVIGGSEPKVSTVTFSR